ncbi:CheR family methyltransferase [Natronobacterium gregoryi]|uniref:protein-glutamate O-methyltransferase n=2 Tax=Natronobacterium gregoryi TaxID=44930 RepID=L0AEA8_NATGS|nr:protein-glutamate O-methyltransferase CheR [Natronobacterium gregoryi]AFZ71764.1 methylase of chemotaxis methyl-accepting protein [Natronobacterium gregoryi SP2]ELY72851.1 chemotaxis protein CheR [Natronobacterium gregoryi SP2]PLK21055.1 protein-glutamate O-methyltransferase CheR [Natronobacterium gregoryi SP2]SFI88359.1 chemotaxis protein methyltransferase CheR [Natronobacterium gregoryi]
MTDDPFDELLSFVENELQFATSHYNDSYLDRRVSSRMRRTGSDSYAEYLSVLQDEPDEQEALLEAMSINVTGFFRNPDVWSGIADVLETLSDEKSSVDVWSAACADGREPYSLAMLAHDVDGIDESRIDILGTDISEPALETAREGVYEESRTADMDDQLSFLDDYSRYVDRDDRTYRIADDVQGTASFERHDLINDDPKSGFDLVVCRNLFIYIDNEYKRSMLEVIAESLRPGGYLVIGKAETIPPTLKSAFSVYDARLRIYQHDSDSGR